MIQFDQVSLSFAGHPLLKEVSFSMQKRDHVGLVGRNGSGKSTLFRLITGELTPDEGSIQLPKDYKLGYLEQHIDFSKPTVREEGCLGLPPGEEDQIYKAEKILLGLGFDIEQLDQNPSELSGGYHLRLHLAKVLISEPDCLLLDEPTNYLDIVSIRWIARFLKNWQGEFILISHDREFMDSVTNHTMGIHRNQLIKAKGDTTHFFNQLLESEELHEKTRVKIDKKRAHMQKYVDRNRAKASKAAQAQSRLKQLEKYASLDKLNEVDELAFSFHETPFTGAKMLEANNLHFSYVPEEPLIQGVSLLIEPKQRIAIVGKNGRGKSTLLGVLTEDLKRNKGTLKLSPNTEIGYFGQTHIDRLDPNHTIEEEIASANFHLNFEEVKRIAGIMMFSQDLSKKKIAQLSGGEKSRVLLGKILAKPCNLLLLDEPTHHLDMESIEALIVAMKNFSGSIVIVTHSELILKRLKLHQLIVCEEAKQTTFLGNYDEFLEKMGWEQQTTASKKKKKKKKTTQVHTYSKKSKKAIDECEKKITLLEDEQKEDLKQLENGEQSHEFLTLLGQKQKELDELYIQLAILYDEQS